MGDSKIPDSPLRNLSDPQRSSTSSPIRNVLRDDGKVPADISSSVHKFNTSNVQDSPNNSLNSETRVSSSGTSFFDSVPRNFNHEASEGFSNNSENSEYLKAGNIGSVELDAHSFSTTSSSRAVESSNLSIDSSTKKLAEPNQNSKPPIANSSLIKKVTVFDPLSPNFGASASRIEPIYSSSSSDSSSLRSSGVLSFAAKFQDSFFNSPKVNNVGIGKPNILSSGADIEKSKITPVNSVIGGDSSIKSSSIKIIPHGTTESSINIKQGFAPMEPDVRGKNNFFNNSADSINNTSSNSVGLPNPSGLEPVSHFGSIPPNLSFPNDPPSNDSINRISKPLSFTSSDNSFGKFTKIKFVSAYSGDRSINPTSHGNNSRVEQDNNDFTSIGKKTDTTHFFSIFDSAPKESANIVGDDETTNVSSLPTALMPSTSSPSSKSFNASLPNRLPDVKLPIKSSVDDNFNSSLNPSTVESFGRTISIISSESNLNHDSSINEKSVTPKKHIGRPKGSLNKITPGSKNNVVQNPSSDPKPPNYHGTSPIIPEKKTIGRPKGSLNKNTLDSKNFIHKIAYPESEYSNTISTSPPFPEKRPIGRPRKSLEDKSQLQTANPVVAQVSAIDVPYQSNQTPKSYNEDSISRDSSESLSQKKRSVGRPRKYSSNTPTKPDLGTLTKAMSNNGQGPIDSSIDPIFYKSQISPKRSVGRPRKSTIDLNPKESLSINNSVETVDFSSNNVYHSNSADFIATKSLIAPSSGTTNTDYSALTEYKNATGSLNNRKLISESINDEVLLSGTQKKSLISSSFDEPRLAVKTFSSGINGESPDTFVIKKSSSVPISHNGLQHNNTLLNSDSLVHTGGSSGMYTLKPSNNNSMATEGLAHSIDKTTVPQEPNSIEDAHSLNLSENSKSSVYNDQQSPVAIKKSRGRPRKLSKDAISKPKRPVGRPRKSLDNMVITPKRPIGRPPKKAITDLNKIYFKSIFSNRKNTESVPLGQLSLTRFSELRRSQELNTYSKRTVNKTRKNDSNSEALFPADSDKASPSISHATVGVIGFLNPAGLDMKNPEADLPESSAQLNLNSSASNPKPEKLNTPKRPVGRPRKNASSTPSANKLKYSQSVTPSQKRPIGRPRKIQNSSTVNSFANSFKLKLSPVGKDDSINDSNLNFSSNRQSYSGDSYTKFKKFKSSHTELHGIPIDGSNPVIKRSVGRPRKSDSSNFISSNDLQKKRHIDKKSNSPKADSELNPLNVEMSLHDDESLREADAIALFARSKKKSFDISSLQQGENTLNQDRVNSRLSEDLEYFSGIKKDNKKNASKSHKSENRTKRSLKDMWSKLTKRTEKKSTSSKDTTVDKSNLVDEVGLDKNSDGIKVSSSSKITTPKSQTPLKSKISGSKAKVIKKVSIESQDGVVKPPSKRGSDLNDSESDLVISSQEYYDFMDIDNSSDLDFSLDSKRPKTRYSSPIKSKPKTEDSDSSFEAKDIPDDSDFSDGLIDGLVSGTIPIKKNSRKKFNKGEKAKANNLFTKSPKKPGLSGYQGKFSDESSSCFIDLVDGRKVPIHLLPDLRDDLLNRVWKTRLSKYRSSNKFYIGKSQLHIPSDVPLMRVASSKFSWELVYFLCSWEVGKKLAIVGDYGGAEPRKLAIDATVYTQWDLLDESDMSRFFQKDSAPVKVSFSDMSIPTKSPSGDSENDKSKFDSPTLEKDLQKSEISSDLILIKPYENYNSMNNSVSVVNSDICLYTLSWCPQTVGPSSYLAAGGVRKSSSFQYYLGKRVSKTVCETEGNVIQLWEHNKLANGLRISLLICHNKGPVWDLNWCPLHPADNHEDFDLLMEYQNMIFSDKKINDIKKKYPSDSFKLSYKMYLDDPNKAISSDINKTEFSFYEPNRFCFIGLLAAVFGDGTAGIFAIPNPDLVDLENSSKVGEKLFENSDLRYRSMKAIHLPKPIVEMNMENTTISKVLWAGSDRVISIGFDGTVAIWSVSKGIEIRMGLSSNQTKIEDERPSLDLYEGDSDSQFLNEINDVPIIRSPACLNNTICASLFPPNILCKLPIDIKSQLYFKKPFEQVQAIKSLVRGNIALYSLNDIILCTGGVAGELQLHKMSFPNFITSQLSRTVVWRNSVTWTQSGDSLIYLDVGSGIKCTNSSNLKFIRNAYFSMIKEVFWEKKIKLMKPKKNNVQRGMEFVGIASSMDRTSALENGSNSIESQYTAKTAENIGDLINLRNKLLPERLSKSSEPIFSSNSDGEQAEIRLDFPYFVEFLQNFIECYESNVKHFQKTNDSSKGLPISPKPSRKIVRDIPWSDGSLKMDQLSPEVAQIINSIKDSNLDDITRTGEIEKLEGDERDMSGMTVADHKSTVWSISNSLCHGYLASSAANGTVFIEETSKKPFSVSSKRNQNLTSMIYTLSADSETGTLNYCEDGSVVSGSKISFDFNATPHILSCIRSTAWHPSIGHGHLLASGGDSGLLRVDSFKREHESEFS
ncbi:hypothetical protein AYI68_g1660 [Smittium mucronatum]|uniref:Uncharacterized protein n=1 Tax=Smittium mucronatum TaxID=133383 RepID=A0A1R0H4W9_9FUNG|nr:hypothetical protein AYI68_g1660 [Smittium mucronatum]